MTNLTVIDYSQLDQYIDDGCFYICDEFHGRIRQTTPQYNQTTVISPEFIMGIRFKALLSSGHGGSNWEQFLRRHFEANRADFQINGSIMSMLGDKQVYNPRVYAFPEEKILAEAEKFITEMAKEKPVIVFGMKFEEHKRFGLDDTAYVKHVDTYDEMMNLQDKATTIDKGVVGLLCEYGIGTDLRFKRDAHVVVVN
jgi:hypothetical protein